MSQLLSVWSGLEMRRRVIVVAATIGVFLAILGLSRIAAQPGMSLLYAGLEPGQAGEVISMLDQRGVQYQVRGGSILVEDAKRDELRMTLATEGLPSNNGAGYELLDTLSGFGTTSQMFDAAYWRAKEGELARTIVASPQIRTARVHIANPSSTPFVRNQNPTASVTITTTGSASSQINAQGLRYLVASAVAGMNGEDVAIIDGKNGQVLSEEDEAVGNGSGTERSDDLQRNVERLLEARVGPGNAIVQVSLDTAMDTESIVERRFDPESRVAISTDVEEVTTNSKDAGAGAVTVASNIPSGDAAANGADSESQSSEIRERTNFEVSETTREIIRGPGTINRMTVAVLVNGLADAEGNWQPRPEEELTDLRELVASAVGFNEARGDVITLKSLEFGSAPIEGTLAGSNLFDRMVLDPMRLIQVAVLGLVALLLGLFVVRPILANRAAENAEAFASLQSLPLAGENVALELMEGAETTVSSVEDGAETVDSEALELPSVASAISSSGDGEADDLTDNALPALEEDPVGHLKSLIEERQPDTIEILKNWMEDDGVRESA